MRSNAQISIHGGHEPAMPTGMLLSNHAQESLYELYNGMFETIVADSDELVDECYRLRYQVYCVEHPFEEPDPAKGEYERDAFDGHSIHALLRHRDSGEFIGTVRLIMGENDSPKRMPVFELCEQHLIKLPEQLYKQRSAEISRFCISKDFRRRITDSMYSSSYTARELAAVRNRVIPFMAIGLMSMVFRLCRAHEIRQSTAVMEPSLIRLLTKLGIYFQPVGEPIEYHGTRQVTYITSAGLHQSLLAERPDVLELMTDRGKFSLDY